jgi:hypothetical protein
MIFLEFILNFIKDFCAKRYKQKISIINTFAGFIEQEIVDLASRPDNVQGAHGIEIWHAKSRRRILAKKEILKNLSLLECQKKSLEEAINEYCQFHVDYIKVKRLGLNEKLNKIYYLSKRLW